MKEITRIHIAKVPYEIEVDAKKEFEQYIDTLERYTSDDEVVMDIEIRITEILEERGVKPDGVITKADIEAIESQVGSPEEIVGDETPGQLEVVDKKLYRDLDHSLLGGVISGLATYFNLDVVLLRVLFVVLAVITSGFALLVYLVMWLMVPAANTAVDKLRLRGRPVTVQAIRAASQEDVSSSRRRGAAFRSALLYIGGVSAVIGALLSLLAVGGASISIFSEGILEQYGVSGSWTIAYGLAVLSGLLLAVLFSLIAYACFRRDFTKRLIAVVTVVIITGMVSFSASVGIGIFGTWQSQGLLQSSVETNRFDLPDNFGSVEELELAAGASYPVSIEYIVDKDPRMILESIPGFEPAVKVVGSKAEIKLNGSGDSRGYLEPVLKVYGPELKRVVARDVAVNYQVKHQDEIDIELNSDARARLSGRIDNLKAILGEGGSLEADDATIGAVEVIQSHGSAVELGNIRSLVSTHQDACPSDGNKPTLEVGSIADEPTVNGKRLPHGSYDTPCFELIYGSDID